MFWPENPVTRTSFDVNRKVSNPWSVANCSIKKAIEFSLPEQWGIELCLTKCSHNSSGQVFYDLQICIVTGVFSAVFCCAATWKIAHEDKSNVNITDIDILITVMHFIECIHCGVITKCSGFQLAIVPRAINLFMKNLTISKRPIFPSRLLKTNHNIVWRKTCCV